MKRREEERRREREAEEEQAHRSQVSLLFPPWYLRAGAVVVGFPDLVVGSGGMVVAVLFPDWEGVPVAFPVWETVVVAAEGVVGAGVEVKGTAGVVVGVAVPKKTRLVTMTS